MLDLLILAGGKGTRLQSVLKDIPKPLAPIQGRPFIDFLIKKFKDFNIYVSVGYMKEKFSEYSCITEDQPAGTGGAIKLAFEKLKPEFLVVINGDTWVDIDLSSICTIPNKIQMHTVFQEDCSRYGRFDGTFKEKGESVPGYINAGVYVIPYDIGIQLPFSLEDFLSKNPNLIQEVRHNCDFIDIGVPEDYAKACTFLR